MDTKKIESDLTSTRRPDARPTRSAKKTSVRPVLVDAGSVRSFLAQLAAGTTVAALASQTQLSHRYASDTRNAPENCGVPRPMSICGAKNHCPFRGHLALTGSTLMCWRRCSRNAVRTVGRRKSRLDHRFSLGALQSELPPPWHVWCLNRSAPHNALISSHIFSSGGKVGSDGDEPADRHAGTGSSSVFGTRPDCYSETPERDRGLKIACRPTVGTIPR